MSNLLSYLVLFCIAFSFSFPKSLGNKIHVKPLSTEEHYKHQDEEDVDDEHNTEFDHDAFLGKEEADEFDELSPQESKLRLSKLIKKIDANGDGNVSEDELKGWLHNIQHRYTWEEVDRKWKEFGIAEDATLTWDQYVEITYGSKDTIETQPGTDTNEMIEKDKMRWAEVDLSKDGFLNKEEFGLLLHPETKKETQHVYAKETFRDIDTNKDGKVDMDEYLNDMGSGSEEEGDADWIKEEKDSFINKLDKDKDGGLDLMEVTEWLMAEELAQVDSETEHLFSQADDNKDKILSEEEILKHHDVFVGSQVTEFGDILHDEF